MQTTSPAKLRWYREVSGTQWKSFLAAWIGYVLDGFDFVLITLVLTEISDDFGLSTVQAASLISGAFITRWLGGAVLGAIGDRYGRKLSMVLSILLYSLGTFACGFAWNYQSLFAARLAIGMGMAGEYSASATYVMESWPARLRSRASGFLISGFSVGSVLAAQVYNWVVPSLGWRWMFYLGLIPIAIALWMRRALPEAEEWTESVAEREDRPNPFRPLFSTRGRAVANTVLVVVATVSLFLVFTPGGAGMVPVLSVVAGLTLAAFAVQLGGKRGWVLYLSMIVTLFFAFLYSWPIQALLPTYLKTELGYSTDQVTDVLYFAGFGTMVGCWTAGFLGDRIGAKKAYALTLLASLAFVYPVFAVHDNLLLLGVLLFLLQATSFGISGLLPRYIGGHFPTASRGAALGFTYNVGALGGAVAPVLGAHLASGMDLGQALAVLTFAGTVIVVLLVGFDVPARLNRLTDPDAERDHLAVTAAER
ncbi:sialate:H+ symport family MFS transporter [Streptomyces sp. NBC_00257]|uniref:sialate:H+ symport family MFS transporter n=1 Tax=Streptomyces TaxID=1883 RepID=UPI0022577C24|nr:MULTISPECIES: sialate:H+ symport family MFS transporter [unclassified Streptomyces]WTB57583.1 sialate:H+ symport family MFS transporter [Streptomyces sp. NBC_00826]WTH89534.1 sialate:H+ symport family MFS transporter [Streptomyces sp. NBC_00825]WTH98261.1 sialate:H+ symport family MFS transporter [Streptomyces sp. NBC_00822]MCX4863616.1 sialate:H+ symport family MFS transporter [Streptomyces sp. NBC_00906]MCX4894854.1 sialate:H+ symport family MFS transporter [Streptomyces sp. NBC_00892]